MVRRCLFPSGIRFCRQFSVLSRYLDPQWSIIGIQSPRPHGPMQTSTNLDEVCEAHLATLLEQQPHGPYYLLGYSLGGTLAQGIAARLRAVWRTGGISWLAGYGRQKRKTGRKKSQWSGPEVLAEINREREKPSGGTAGSTSTELFTTIERQLR